MLSMAASEDDESAALNITIILSLTFRCENTSAMLAVFFDDGKKDVIFSSKSIREAIRTSMTMLENIVPQKAAL